MRLRGIVLEPSLERTRVAATFGIGSVDAAGNEGRIAPPASIVATWRTPPTVPAIVYPPVNMATPADYHGTSWFTVTWTAQPGVGYQVYRAMDLDLLASAGIALADHRAMSDDDQRLQLQQLALDRTTSRPSGSSRQHRSSARAAARCTIAMPCRVASPTASCTGCAPSIDPATSRRGRLRRRARRA
jgi:hypothetical protein